MTTLVDDLVPDELWALVELLLPAPPRPPHDRGGDRRQRQRHHAHRAYLRRRGIRPRIARRRVESSTNLGRHRWKAERVRHEAP